MDLTNNLLASMQTETLTLGSTIAYDQPTGSCGHQPSNRKMSETLTKQLRIIFL
jgi:hypothetical protein